MFVCLCVCMYIYEGMIKELMLFICTYVLYIHTNIHIQGFDQETFAITDHVYTSYIKIIQIIRTYTHIHIQEIDEETFAITDYVYTSYIKIIQIIHTYIHAYMYDVCMYVCMYVLCIIHKDHTDYIYVHTCICV